MKSRGGNRFFKTASECARRAALPIFFALAAYPACAEEITAARGDTFIFEAAPNRDFSKSDFLAVNNAKGERAIAYIPFEFDAPAVGLAPSRDVVITATLSIFVKKLPLVPASNAQSAESLPPPPAGISAELAGKKLESSAENRLRIEVFGIVDEETFEPNTKNYRVSWDGKTDAPAPKHNTLDDRLDTSGLAKLGEIEIDLEKENFDDGDRIEFTSDELVDFISFCYGSTTAHGKTPLFRTSLDKIRYASIVLKQDAGPSGVFFYAADSFGKKSAESGDEAEGKSKKSADSEDGQASETAKLADTAENPQKAESVKTASEAANNAEELKAAANALPNTASTEGLAKSAEKAEAAPHAIPSAAGSARKTPALEAFAQESVLLKAKEDSKPDTEQSEAQSELAEKKPKKENRDFRPRINFEFRADSSESVENAESSENR